MTNKYLEKVAEYSDKNHANRHMFGVYGLASKELRKRESLGGFMRTQGRMVLEGTAGQVAGSVAGGTLGHLASRGNRGVAAAGAIGGALAGGVGGMYHGALASVRNRIAAGKLKDVKDTSKK